MGRGGSGKQLVALEDGQRLIFADRKPAPALVIAGSRIGDLAVIDPFKAIHEAINHQIETPCSNACFLNCCFPLNIALQAEHGSAHLQFRVIRTCVGFSEGIKSVPGQLYFGNLHTVVVTGVDVSHVQRIQQSGRILPAEVEIAHQGTVHVAVSLNGDIEYLAGGMYHGINPFKFASDQNDPKGGYQRPIRRLWK